MPTVPLPGPYRFFFYSYDCREPMHVHVQRERALCKFWLDREQGEPVVELQASGQYAAHELRKIERLILKHFDQIENAWIEHCGG